MIEKTFKSITVDLGKGNIFVVYRLHFKNALYSIECYKEGENQINTLNYSLIEDVTDDEGEAETFLYCLSKGKVLPVHIKDMVEDYFG